MTRSFVGTSVARAAQSAAMILLASTGAVAQHHAAAPPAAKSAHSTQESHGAKAAAPADPHGTPAAAKEKDAPKVAEHKPAVPHDRKATRTVSLKELQSAVQRIQNRVAEENEPAPKRETAAAPHPAPGAVTAGHSAAGPPAAGHPPAGPRPQASRQANSIKLQWRSSVVWPLELVDPDSSRFRLKWLEPSGAAAAPSHAGSK